ncbi:MAG: molybdopterin synthase catalytic subunit [Paracoccaceae bacterium]|jgi:molybdopterin synthase catalytic subunit
MMLVRVQSEAFDFTTEVAGFTKDLCDCGAVVTFTGIVRNNHAGDLLAMEIEHYPAMTCAALESIAAKAMAKWSLIDCMILHRFGRLELGAPIMMVATAAGHRAAAFSAANFMMDYLKSCAPFWKKEITRSQSNWVLAKEIDQEALTRWSMVRDQ